MRIIKGIFFVVFLFAFIVVGIVIGRANPMPVQLHFLSYATPFIPLGGLSIILVFLGFILGRLSSLTKILRLRWHIARLQRNATKK